MCALKERLRAHERAPHARTEKETPMGSRPQPARGLFRLWPGSIRGCCAPLLSAACSAGWGCFSPERAQSSRPWRPTRRCCPISARRSPAGSRWGSPGPGRPGPISPGICSSPSRPRIPERSRPGSQRSTGERLVATASSSSSRGDSSIPSTRQWSRGGGGRRERPRGKRGDGRAGRSPHPSTASGSGHRARGQKARRAPGVRAVSCFAAWRATDNRSGRGLPSSRAQTKIIGGHRAGLS